MSTSKREIKRNLRGAMDVALFMRGFEKSFGTSYDEALRSFFVPVLAFPIILGSLFLFTSPELLDEAGSTLSLLYALRYAGAVALFLSLVYLLASKLGRHHHFNQFIIAYNWTALPVSFFLMPLLLACAAGFYTPDELLPIFVAIGIYALAMTAYIAARIFRLPMELGMFFAFISLGINKGSFDLMGWVVPVISG